MLSCGVTCIITAKKFVFRLHLIRWTLVLIRTLDQFRPMRDEPRLGSHHIWSTTAGTTCNRYRSRLTVSMDVYVGPSAFSRGWSSAYPALGRKDMRGQLLVSVLASLTAQRVKEGFEGSEDRGELITSQEADQTSEARETMRHLETASKHGYWHGDVFLHGPSLHGPRAPQLYVTQKRS